MRSLAILALLICTTALHAQVSAPQPRRIQPAGADDGLFQYQYDRGEVGFNDLLILQDGSQRTGKIMEWADQFLLYDGHGNREAFDGDRVRECQFRRAPRHRVMPKLPDLTVAFVERLPRDPHWHGHVTIQNGVPVADLDGKGVAWHQPVGKKVQFRVHVRNAGSAASEAVAYRVLIDDGEIGAGQLNPIQPGAEQVIEATWPWAEGRKQLRVSIDPAGKQREVVRWNNEFREATDALGVAVVVGRDVYESVNGTANIVDSFCFEDWVQYQIRCMNGLFAASIYPSAPHGVTERVRCDRIIVVDNAISPDKWKAQLYQGSDAKSWCEEAATLVLSSPSDDLRDYAVRVDWKLLQQLGGELGLTSLRSTDTQISQSLVTNQYDRYVPIQHLFPWPRTLMHTAAGFPLSEVCAAYLNQARGKPRGFKGEYLYQLPEKTVIEVRANNGAPLEAVQVDAFQLQSEGDSAGFLAGIGRDPLFSAATDAGGRLELPGLPSPAMTTPNGYQLRPNPFGKIATDGSNGLLLLRLRHRLIDEMREEFHFLRLFDCNLAFIQGHKDVFLHAISTRFPPSEEPKSPPQTFIAVEDHSKPLPDFKLRWRTRTSLFKIEEFRIYRKTGFGGDDETPWTLASTVRRSSKKWALETPADYFKLPPDNPGYSADTYFAISAVDKQGRESGLAGQTFAAWNKDSFHFAIDTEQAYMTLSGDGPSQMLHWDANIGTQPFLVNTSSVRGYKPGFAGIAITPEHRVLVSDTANHVLAIYDANGNLEELFPRRALWPGFPSAKPGEFYDPMDVAVDKGGTIYVADRGNNRVQILDSQCRSRGMLDVPGGFLRPHSLAWSNGHLAVTDNVGSRIRIFKQDGDKLILTRELIDLTDADRAIVSKTGQIYVTARDPASMKNGILTFSADPASRRVESAAFDGEMGKVFDPRSAYLYDYLQDDYLYVLNRFPFDVRRFKME